MKNILVLGAGAMGAAFTVPCIDNKHKVTLCEPYNHSLVKKILSKKKYHPSLKLNLPKNLIIKNYSKELFKKKWDLLVIAVSSIGIASVGAKLLEVKNKSPILILTKGLHYEKKGQQILTMSEQLKKVIKKGNISVLKGPCLARELAKKIKTSVVIANKNIKIAKSIGKLISTNFYKMEYSTDVKGVEVCSAIKNIYSMIIGSGEGLNTSSSLFRKSITEMIYLTKFFKGKEETVYGLAGLGDLYVSALGGRNSKIGEYLGKGFTYNKAKKKFMPNDTIEGAQLASIIAPYILKKIDTKKIPLMVSLIESIIKNKKLEISL
jgi:glycerol-3-phosphate dehydrogenase (NAD(P)+)|tara:strand:- start:194 stop:1156 length:963 start_codon:yes stop_codon:yes gene_type:complete